MTVKVKNTMQPSKLLFFILIVLIVVPISSSEQQEEKEECSIVEEVFEDCTSPLPENFTVPEPRETKTKECSTTDNGLERCVEKTLINGTYVVEHCTEDGTCFNVTKKNEKYTTSDWTFPKLW